MASTPTAASSSAKSEEEVAAQQAYLILARRLRQLSQPICGLWPVSENTEFEEVPARLGGALASLGVSVGLVAPRERWLNDAPQDELLISKIGEAIDSLTPAWARSLGATIERTLDLVRDRYACLLLDLSGLDLAGAHEVALVPGVGIVLFVAEGQTGEFALAKMRRRFPADRLMGAVLLNGETGSAGTFARASGTQGR
jgi:hypothetical protein